MLDVLIQYKVSDVTPVGTGIYVFISILYDIELVAFLKKLL